MKDIESGKHKKFENELISKALLEEFVSSKQTNQSKFLRKQASGLDPSTFKSAPVTGWDALPLLHRILTINGEEHTITGGDDTRLFSLSLGQTLGVFQVWDKDLTSLAQELGVSQVLSKAATSLGQVVSSTCSQNSKTVVAVGEGNVVERESQEKKKNKINERSIYRRY
uniref:PPM-type phosphatase domain-containing protein n=1 Tax=Caenorhabditis tropicalis TaxID=1561998 RepID=A0A1I7TFD7_9PELO